MKGITSNFELIDLAGQLNMQLTAVIYKDELKNYNSKKKDSSFILDLHDSTDRSTGHWTMLYVKGNKAVYFDSFGIIYPQAIKKFCGNRKIEWNNKQLQQLNEDWCGGWCLACLWHLQKGGTLKSFIDKFN